MNCDHQCSSCKSCSSCGGCNTRDLTMTAEELAFLRIFEELPFLPVARKADSEEPVYLEDTIFPLSVYSNIISCLEKKGLISLDYDKPIKGWNQEKYITYTHFGSMALTERGQSVLDIYSIQGVEME